jgi:hypothetical protein
VPRYVKFCKFFTGDFFPGPWFHADNFLPSPHGRGLAAVSTDTSGLPFPFLIMKQNTLYSTPLTATQNHYSFGG